MSQHPVWLFDPACACLSACPHAYLPPSLLFLLSFLFSSFHFFFPFFSFFLPRSKWVRSNSGQTHTAMVQAPQNPADIAMLKMEGHGNKKKRIKTDREAGRKHKIGDGASQSVLFSLLFLSFFPSLSLSHSLSLSLSLSFPLSFSLSPPLSLPLCVKSWTSNKLMNID